MLKNMDAKIYQGKYQNGYVPPEVRKIEKLDVLIEEYFKVHKFASFYCDALNVSERMINNHLKFYGRPSVFQLILQRTFTEAENLLCFSNMAVKEIAYELGYNDVGYFIRAFKKTMGVTPKDYRNRFKISRYFAHAV